MNTIQYNTYDLMEEEHDGFSVAHVECTATSSVNNISVSVAPRAAYSQSIDSTEANLPVYHPIPLEGAATTLKHAKTFDRYSPEFADFMFQDAIQNSQY